MRLIGINGKLINKNVSKYKINWHEPSASNLQYQVKQFLCPYWKHQIVYEEFPVYQTRMRVDILNATKRIAVEVNGTQHSQYSKFFHGNRANYLRSIKRDFKKLEWLELNKFKLIEIEADEVEQLTEEFIEKKFNIII
jgi:hypothetical protein